ncbi:hypothetical protein ASF84_20110 [Pseudomonas sp. Leaf127]|uniref:calcium-binding protein n=1 Tax=Pseudomonas sp. Leaf127 TaxID=1736267 RepID=UPI000702C95B|nr:hypothetical protein ASF84_20110 [Pseudomonas sp. Leaf127]
MIATGGAGRDTYEFISGSSAYRLTITDFATGAGGDLIDVSTLLDHSAANGRGYQGGNPMSAANGYLRLVQNGKHTELQYDEDGAAGTKYAWHTAMTLQNVLATAVNAHNFNPLKIEGTTNADVLTGGLGVDVLDGGAGNDTLDGSWGADSMTGGTGNDTYYVDNAGDVVIEKAGEGTDTVRSTASTFTLSANVESGRIDTSAAANLVGNSLNNILSGSSGKNVLNGGLGNDNLSGGSGNDTLIGGGGKDTLVGGAGNDLFDFNAVTDTGLASITRDVISDFVRGQDKIDLSTLDANTATSTNDAFDSLITGAAFSGRFASVGDLYFDNKAQVLYGNIDADAEAEFSIQLVGVTALSTADLIL